MEDNKITRYIYGAGKYGKLLLEYFFDIGIEINYFVQTDEPNSMFINEIPVIAINDIKESEKEQKIIYIAISNAKIVKEIKDNIYAQYEQDNVKVYDCKNFIVDNLLDKRKKCCGGTKECIICEENIDEFLPAGIEQKIFSNYHIIGGGYRKNAICPCCSSLDRERWLYYVLKNKLKVFEKMGRILHFAPEKSVSKLIGKNEKIDYYTGDIEQGKAMHVTDITDIQYKDNTFDYVLCNHVMEHIIDEEKAVSEIKRVLKPEGKWIFSFPICTDMKTYEDKAIITPLQRLEAYGQEDHVRLYGNDFVERFEKYDLNIEIYSPKDELNESMIEKYGLIKDDIIIIATQKL